MKKVMNKINFAVICMMTSVAAFAAGGTASSQPDYTGLCQLIVRLKSVFQLIRTLAFIGAAFLIAGWAWGYISNAGKGEDKGGFGLEDVKKKGIALLVGFSLLFMIGLILSFIMSVPGMESIGCKAELTNPW